VVDSTGAIAGGPQFGIVTAYIKKRFPGVWTSCVKLGFISKKGAIKAENSVYIKIHPQMSMMSWARYPNHENINLDSRRLGAFPRSLQMIVETKQNHMNLKIGFDQAKNEVVYLPSVPFKMKSKAIWLPFFRTAHTTIKPETVSLQDIIKGNWEE
jgi:hypothetical protein